ncbi:MAG: hypothetical protein ACRCYD_15590 [Plesiomonas sp.]
MIFHVTQADGLAKLKSLFPELTEKQFLLTLRWVLGADFVDLSIDNESSIDGVKKVLQRSKAALGLERLEAVRPLFLSRVTVGLFMAMNSPSQD